MDRRIALRVKDSIPALANLKKVKSCFKKSSIVRVLSDDNLQSKFPFDFF